MANRLRPLTKSSTTISESSTGFLQRIKDISIEEDEVMVSFDEKSLFTAIPRDLSVRVVKECLDTEIGEDSAD